MANKRDLKKRVRMVCGDLASDALLASVLFTDKVDREKINKIINDIAELQEKTLARISFSYPKSRRDFETVAEYNRAHREYYATAFNKLNKDFLDEALEIVKHLNDVVPADARKVVSSM